MPRAAYYLVFVASGFAGLIYESIWTHYLKLFLGHAAYAQSLVLAVFMGGMALGAWWCGRLSARMANPLRVYALVEAVIGIFALAFHALFVSSTDWAYAAILPAVSGEWPVLAAKLGLCVMLIFPQSVLLGMTFPLMSAGLARAYPRKAGESVAMLYFTNSLGAAAGVLASGFMLIPQLGLPGTLNVAGALNAMLAMAVWLSSRPSSRPLAREPSYSTSPAGLLLAVAFLTGLASFVYEIAWIRMLSLVLGASTHSFELMLATFILGLALGGLAVHRRVDRLKSPERALAIVQLAMALAAALTLPLYDLSFSVMEALMRGLARSETGYTLFNLSGAAVAAMVMLPATFFAGMTLPLLTSALLRRGAGEAAIGEVYAANTVGAIAGVVVAVHVLLPMLGLKGALIVGSALDAALGIVLLRRHAAGRWAPAVVAGAATAVLAWTTHFVHLDVNKMTAGVFRYGEIAASRDAEVLYARDGKTATVHLVRYDEATSLRTNGKSDGSINLDPGTERGSDEITMVLTAGLPLALKPDARSAAVIGIGTGLTSHTLLQSLDIERVDTIEIEPAMAEAARGFLPRNSGAFADPRGSIVVDDAKSYFAAGHRRYDLIISEPSNPWVSGVSSLFTREFYERVQGHLAEGGILVQWFQLYEIGPSLVASVMGALGGVFPHYAVFAPSDHDLLIMASRDPLPLPAKPQVFEHPGLAKELWTVHVLSAGDLDARYLGERRTLEPLFASYGMPHNSDYAPVLDSHAARHRFMERSSASIVGLLNAEIPLLELLDPARSRRPVNPLFQGAYAFGRVENARLARYGLSFLLEPRPPAPMGIPIALQKDLELVKLRLIECRAPRDLDAWLSSALRVAKALNPYLAASDASAAWRAVSASACFGTLHGFQRQWIRLFQAVAERDATRMAALAAPFLADSAKIGAEAKEYLVMAAMAGLIASGRKDEALALWERHHADLRNEAEPPFRLLRCHAEQGGVAGCAGAFADYAER